MAENNKIEQVQLKRSSKSIAQLDSEGVKLKYGEPAFLPTEKVLVIGGQDENNLISKELRIKMFEADQANLDNQVFYKTDPSGYNYLTNQNEADLHLSANYVWSPSTNTTVEERLNSVAQKVNYFYSQTEAPNVSNAQEGSFWVNYNNPGNRYLSVLKSVNGSKQWRDVIADGVPNATSTTAGLVKLGASGGAATYAHTHNYAGSSTPGGGSTKVKTTAATSQSYYLVGTQVAGESSDLYAATPNSSATYKTGVYFDASRGVLMGAAWNDIAEFRKGHAVAGKCVNLNEEGVLSTTKKRLSKNAYIVSDTFGFAIGETDEAKLPVAIAGRVLAFPDGNLKVGDVVCSGENGTVSKMNRLEIILFPDRIVGIVDEIPDYEVWNDVKVENRVWVKVK